MTSTTFFWMIRLLFHFILNCIISGIMVKIKALCWTISFSSSRKSLGEHFMCTEVSQTKQSASGVNIPEKPRNAHIYCCSFFMKRFACRWHQLFDCWHYDYHQTLITWQARIYFFLGLAAQTDVGWAIPPKLMLLLDWFGFQFTNFQFWLNWCVELTYL